MYTLLLDFEIRFLPPMYEHGPGVLLTRELQLPFPPWKGLRIFSKVIDDCPEPEGMQLDDVVWEMDRRVFLATTELIDSGSPIPDIPRLLKSWLCRGWKFGSFRDPYRQDEDDDAPSPRTSFKPIRGSKRLARIGPAHKAMIRFMVESRNDPAAAYAMDLTGLHYDQKEIQSARTCGTMDERMKAYSNAFDSYIQMRDSRRQNWEESVTKRYPDLLEMARNAEPY